MSARVLKVTKCGECPFADMYVSCCTPARRNFVDHRGMRTTHPSTIPDWCPLPKDPDHA